MRCGVWGSGFRVWGFRVWGLGTRVEGLVFGVKGLGFSDLGSKFVVWSWEK